MHYRIIVIAMLAGANASAQRGPQRCAATATSLTPTGWHSPAAAIGPAPKAGLTLVRELQLPGPANRFDYQSIDSAARRLYVNHMNAGKTIVIDLDAGRVIGEINDVPRATGVKAVPSHHSIYISAAGAHEVAIVDERTLEIKARVHGIDFPDGIAFAPDADKVFVSDESGGTDVVIDAKTEMKRSTIDLGGEAGNTHYDAVSHCILVAVQTRNQLVAIDPWTERIVARYDVSGCEHPHGFAIAEADRMAFVSCEGNAALVVLDLRGTNVIGQYKVADDPDVLAWDPHWRRLYVAAESGVLSIWWLSAGRLHALGEIRAPHAHTVAVDVLTHRVYVPLENIAGRPVLRILSAR